MDHNPGRMIDAAMQAIQAGEVPEPPPPREPPGGEAGGGRRGFPYTDLGNAERLTTRHGMDLRYCHTWKGWLIWDGCRWKPDENGEIFRRVAETVRSIYAEAAGAADRDTRRAIVKWAKDSESRRAISATEELARHMEGIPVTVEELDLDDYLLNCQNGTVNLKTGELHAPKRDQMITRLAPIPYDPTATCPDWDSFVGEIMLGRANLVDYLKRSVGYSLTADVTEKVVFICHGGGNNGKTTFLETLKSALGDYSGQVLVESLMVQRNTNGNAPSPDIADLRGMRFVTSSESEDGSRLAEGKVKYLTGMSTVKARRLHENGWQFRPTWKIWMDCNHLPSIRGTDNAIWERIRRIPFELTLEPHQIDRGIPGRLKTELAGILRWAVDGCRSWAAHGLMAPPEVATATDLYHSQMDVLGRFLEECTTQGLPSSEVRASQLYTVYGRWCASVGEFTVSARIFGERLTDRGIQKRHTKHGAVYSGLRISSESDVENEELIKFNPVTGDGW